MNELVSAIITTHNRLDMLKRAVESVISQTYPKIEVIIVDDASDDGTKEWCRNLVKDNKSHRNIRFINIPKNKSRGGNYARNLGIGASNGDLVAFLDDDDVWLPEKITRQVEVMKATNCGVVYGGRIVEMMQPDGEARYIPSQLNPEYQGDVSRKILTAIFTTTSLILVKKQLLIAAGLFDENLKFWQEYELMIRLAQLTDFRYADTPLIQYRVDYKDPARLTNKYDGWRLAVNYVHRKHRGLYRKLSFNKYLKSKALVWEDASNRCKAAGMNKKAKYFRRLYNSWRIYNAVLDGSIFRKIKNRIK